MKTPPPIRILLVAASLDILGGQAVQAHQLWKRFQDDEDVAMDFLPVNPRLPGPLRVLQRIKYVRTVVTSLAFFISLLRQVHRYDVIHAFSASYWSFLLSAVPPLLVARLWGKPTILNYHSGEADDHLRNWKTALWGVRQATAVVVPSGYLVGVFGRHGVRATAVFNTVDRDRFAFRRRSPLEPRFFSNRNFEPLYNVACTIRGFAAIRQRFPAATLTLAGDGSQRAALVALSQDLGLDVTFLGAVAPARMPSCYEENEIYLNTPNIDNMPISVLEAFSAGLPVVTTNAGGIPFLVDHGRTGRLVNCDDAESLAREAIWLLENPAEAETMVGTAYRESERYEWKTVRLDWLRTYTALANRK